MLFVLWVVKTPQMCLFQKAEWCIQSAKCVCMDKMSLHVLQRLPQAFCHFDGLGCKIPSRSIIAHQWNFFFPDWDIAYLMKLVAFNCLPCNISCCWLLNVNSIACLPFIPHCINASFINHVTIIGLPKETLDTQLLWDFAIVRLCIDVWFYQCDGQSYS